LGREIKKQRTKHTPIRLLPLN